MNCKKFSIYILEGLSLLSWSTVHNCFLSSSTSTWDQLYLYTWRGSSACCRLEIMQMRKILARSLFNGHEDNNAHGIDYYHCCFERRGVLKQIRKPQN